MTNHILSKLTGVFLLIVLTTAIVSTRSNDRVNDSKTIEVYDDIDDLLDDCNGYGKVTYTKRIPLGQGLYANSVGIVDADNKVRVCRNIEFEVKKGDVLIQKK